MNKRAAPAETCETQKSLSLLPDETKREKALRELAEKALWEIAENAVLSLRWHPEVKSHAKFCHSGNVNAILAAIAEARQSDRQLLRKIRYTVYRNGSRANIVNEVRQLFSNEADSVL